MDPDSVFLKFLRDEGYQINTSKGVFPNCPWIYVDIEKNYMPMPYLVSQLQVS